jgi:hypothetical protein
MAYVTARTLTFKRLYSAMPGDIEFQKGTKVVYHKESWWIDSHLATKLHGAIVGHDAEYYGFKVDLKDVATIIDGYWINQGRVITPRSMVS